MPSWTRLMSERRQRAERSSPRPGIRQDLQTPLFPLGFGGAARSAATPRVGPCFWRVSDIGQIQ
eukprot:15476436-Alexandrium_andersonii.AAC.1